MRYFSLFTGIGGFELGIQQAYERLYNGSDNSRESQTKGQLSTTGEGVAGESSQSDSNKLQPDAVVCVGFSEVDKYATQIYQSHFPTHQNYGDITTINADALPDFDLLCGGFPCQAFSVAGKRRGFDDTRGTLFFDICRLAKTKRPRLLLLENVKGLLNHDGGQTFRVILSSLDELGYDCQWQVCNSKDFGVPQNRERVIIVGHLRGTSRPEVFPLIPTDGENTQPNNEAVGVNNPSRGYEPRKDGLASSLRSGESGSKNIIQLNNPTHSNNRIYRDDGISPTLNTAQGGNRQPKIPSGTQIRRLTPTECERLQGFPDGWTAGVSDTQRYKTLGNAVTTNVIKEVMMKIL